MEPARTIAIGDIHGCSVPLVALLRVIAPRSEDVIVTLGDVIDRGPDSRGVIDQLLTLETKCHLVPLLGNHEEMLFAAFQGESDLRYWRRFGGDTALASYGASHPKQLPYDHIEFLKRCRRFHETDTHIFVHANYWPNRPMPEQSSTTLFWEHLQPGSVARHCSGKKVVVGHTPQMSGHILDLGPVVCIDTGCGGGGWLTALEVATGRFWQANESGAVREGKLPFSGS
jgi:serine/threonine protein phosphatase 1